MSILDHIIGLYAPHSCVGCGNEGFLVCDACRLTIRTAQAVCYRCDSPSPLGRTCRDCRQESQLVSLNCFTQYEGPAKDLLWALKFERAQAAATTIADMLAEQFACNTPEDAIIVPLPTAMKRVRKRGYDQAVLVARAYAKRTGCQYAPLLQRYGNQEQKGAGRQQRLHQLDGSLRIRHTADIAGKRIILVDDVVTTGASMEAAASVLKTSGAKVVAGLAFARA